MAMKLSMPIGEDDFKKVRENHYFVEKSRFLSAFFPGHAEVTLFTRPRRFGKTLTLSMLRYFFDLEGADEHRQLFDGLAVSHDAAMMAEMGQLRAEGIRHTAPAKPSMRRSTIGERLPEDVRRRLDELRKG